ncbi:hypothetical protein PISMIDRAFT_347000 [Pisolithus microcarpus 441]|uniref:Uncharacterized protein n=1 Tax=Pisolithus microcarpus 441 TaxID=765257 RepID=A0A0C9XQR7_9AGAM|nr:hypothetical protein PISMIDRAFT_347000 [Pisolithus microcarpus 441]
MLILIANPCNRLFAPTPESHEALCRGFVQHARGWSGCSVPEGNCWRVSSFDLFASVHGMKSINSRATISGLVLLSHSCVFRCRLTTQRCIPWRGTCLLRLDIFPLAT